MICIELILKYYYINQFMGVFKSCIRDGRIYRGENIVKKFVLKSSESAGNFA